jgi:hypothetical protein
MNYVEILKKASERLDDLRNRRIDVLDITKPKDIDYAKQLSKIVSKLSPLLGNMIEYASVDALNEIDWKVDGKWHRQDPGFPDTVFIGDVKPMPGIEIKTWFPFATEITARFKDSVTHFKDNQINVALIAWLPEYIIFGKPQIIDVMICSAASVANARDKHYHKPPHYLVFEPEDTSARTSNLQQTNTNGYVFQGSAKEFEEIKKLMKTWKIDDADSYSSEKSYQDMIKSLIGQYSYRLDTNFAKMDRIGHEDIEKFKDKVLNQKFHGRTIREWGLLLANPNEAILDEILALARKK